MVQFGGAFARCAPLTLEQNSFCMLIGFGSIAWALVIKLILPALFFNGLSVNQKIMDEL